MRKFLHKLESINLWPKMSDVRTTVNATQSSWEQAFCIFSRLPGELRIEIYELTLVASERIVVLNEEWGLGPYHPLETSKIECEGLITALHFYVWSRYAIFADDAHAYFLHRNRFILHSRGAARNLVQLTDDLLGKGCSVSIRSLEVVVGPDPSSERDNCAYINNGQLTGDPDDFDPGDGRHAGLRALRTLKVLLQLPRLQDLHISLFQISYDIIFATNNHFNNGLLLVGAVIAKLKDLVQMNNSCAGFKVTIQNAHYDDVTDITHLWDGTRDASELAHAEDYDVVWQEYLKLDARVRRAEHALYWCRSYHNTTGLGNPNVLAEKERRLDDLKNEKQEMREKMNALPASQLDGSDMFVRPLIERLAQDPDWEAKAEALAKRPPAAWYYDEVIGRKRLYNY